MVRVMEVMKIQIHFRFIEKMTKKYIFLDIMVWKDMENHQIVVSLIKYIHR